MSLVIIHLTDIHLTHAGSNPVLEKIDKLSQACSSILTDGDDVVISITGDVAAKGQSNEYYIAQEMIQQITDYICKEHSVKVYTILVPGNHDCDFSTNQTIRDHLHSGISCRTGQVDEEIVRELCKVQANYCEFAKRYGQSYDNPLINEIEIPFMEKRIRFILINSAWMSTKHEKAGSMCLPENLLPPYPIENADLSIVMMHHPYYWFHPDNAIIAEEYLRNIADIVLFGHEHRSDEKAVSGKGWSILQLNGKELQGDNPEKSAFAAYVFSQELDTFRNIEFLWDTERRQYFRSTDDSRPFSRNAHCMQKFFVPNKETQLWIDDPGFIIQHFKKEDVSLSDVYCWPELETISFDRTTEHVGVRIRDNIPEYIQHIPSVLIVGESLHGKTAFAKMLYKDYFTKRRCCVFCDARKFSSFRKESIVKEIEKKFCSQYSCEQIEIFRQMQLENKTVFVDNFEHIGFLEDKRDSFLSTISNLFGQVVLLSNTDLLMPIGWMSDNGECKREFVQLRILPMGNLRRMQFIEHWYHLGNEDLENDSNFCSRIEHAKQIIDEILGNQARFIPAVPIHMINILQNIDGLAGSTQSISEYGYLFDSLIKRNLSAIENTTVQMIGIYIEILSAIAFDMLQQKSYSFSERELHQSIKRYKEKYKLKIDATILVQRLAEAKMIRKDSIGKYHFSYSYIFYYFVGRYISEHISDKTVEDKIYEMSTHLYIEAYGNIMVFVCYFANSNQIIETVLLNAYSLFENIEPFDFSKHSDFQDSINETIEKTLRPQIVGEDSDVPRQKKEALIRRDENKIGDGTAKESHDSEFSDVDESESKIAMFSNAMKTMDVLGQIVTNYPGKIDGDMKCSIVDEIHQLGLRVITSYFDVFGYLQEGIITMLAEYARERDANAQLDEIISYVKMIFARMLSIITGGLIQRIAHLIGSEHLDIVNEETLAHSNSISGKLILFEIAFNKLNSPHYSEAIDEYKELKKRKLLFAASILQGIVATYLKYHKCKTETRDRVCSEMGLSKKDIIVSNMRALND